MKWYEYVVLIFGSGLIGVVIQLCISNYFAINISQIEKQKEVYSEFLLQLQTVASDDQNDNTFGLVVSRNKALLYASPETANAINDYVNKLANSEQLSKEEHDECYSNIIHSMRSDLKLSEKSIDNIHFIIANAPKNKE